MQKSALILALALSALPLAAVEIGNTYDQVVAEIGAPSSKMVLGDVLVLNYPDKTIKLRDSKVIAIKPVSAHAATENVVAAPLAAAGRWTSDYAAALTQAKTEKRKVLLFFTGSDWCVWCKRLDKEVLSTNEFATYARDNLILVKLDFPHETPQAPQLKAQNQKLSEKYKIEGFPTIVVLNSEGKTLSTLGYEEGGATPYVKKLKSL
jgi:thiol:disulfide interchange protein